MKTILLFILAVYMSKSVSAQVPIHSQHNITQGQYDLLKYWNLRDRMDWWVKQGYVDVHNNCPVNDFGKAYGYNLDNKQKGDENEK